MSAALVAADETFSSSAVPFGSESTTTGPVEPGRSKLKGAFEMPLDRIRPDPNQPRKKIDPQYLGELTKTVKQHGILQPITLRYDEQNDVYLILSGECRYTAAKAAGLDRVPVWVRTPKNEEILLQQVIENWTRSDLNPFELADSLAQIRDANQYNQTQLANATGKNKSEVSRLLSILELDAETQRIARDDSTGRITKRHLFAIARLAPDEQKKMLARVQRDDVTALDLERAIARQRKTSTGAAKRGAPVTYRRYSTKQASVVLTFRKQEVSDEDVLYVLSEIRRQIKEDAA